MATLVKSAFSNHFINISNFFEKVCYLKEKYSFWFICFVVQWNVISNDNIQSFQLSFEILFQLQLELEGSLLDQNLDELENELSRI